jgi:hypothetical protein
MDPTKVAEARAETRASCRFPETQRPRWQAGVVPDTHMSDSVGHSSDSRDAVHRIFSGALDMLDSLVWSGARICAVECGVHPFWSGGRRRSCIVTEWRRYVRDGASSRLVVVVQSWVSRNKEKVERTKTKIMGNSARASARR